MNNRVLRDYARITALISKFTSELKNLQHLIDTQIPYLFSISDLDYLETKVRKTDKLLQEMYSDLVELKNKILSTQRQHTKRNISVTFDHNKLIAHSDKSKTAISDKILENIKKDPQIKEILENYPESTRKLFNKINDRRYQLKVDCKALKKEFKNNLDSGFDISKYHEFLTNPLLKVKINHNKFFEPKVRKLNKYDPEIRKLNEKFIDDYARNIAESNRRLFLKITRKEILSPWNYNKPGVDLNLKAFSANFNAIAYIVKSAILKEEDIEKRTLAIEEWIWIANHLLTELHDYSGFQAICSALDSSPISRLKKSFSGISNEAKVVLEHLQTVAIGELTRGELSKATLNSSHPVIPFLATFLKDFTFIKDGNTATDINSGSEIKRKRIEECTAGGKKLIIEFDVLQKKLRSEQLTTSVNSLLSNQLREIRESSNFSNEDEEYERSQQLEPLQNNLKPAAALKLFDHKISKPLKNVNPTIKQMVFREIINCGTVYLSGLKNETNSNLQHEINWAQTHQRITEQHMKSTAYIDALNDYINTSKDNVIVKEAKSLISELQAFTQIQANDLEISVTATLQRAQVILSASKKITETSHTILTSSCVVDAKYLSHLNSKLSAIAVQLKSFQATLEHITSLNKHIHFTNETSQQISHIENELKNSLYNINTFIPDIQIKVQEIGDSSWERAAPVTAAPICVPSQIFLTDSCKQLESKAYSTTPALKIC